MIEVFFRSMETFVKCHLQSLKCEIKSLYDNGNSKCAKYNIQIHSVKIANIRTPICVSIHYLIAKILLESNLKVD